MVEIAHHLLTKEIKKDDIILDMTMGNGHDTLFLSKLSNHIYAFDIQQDALDRTSLKLFENSIEHVKLILDDHINFDQYIHIFKGAIFNLGYLPHGNKNITTLGEHTVLTTKKLLKHLIVGGFIQYVVYIGHASGKEESKMLESYLKTLDPKTYQIVKVCLPFIENNPPYILMVYKKSEA